MKVFYSLLLVLVLYSASAHAGPPKICTTIKPLYGIVEAVTAGITKPLLLIDSVNKSPHNYSLKPSDVEKISTADIIFLIDLGFESFMLKTTKLNDKAHFIEIAKDNLIKLLPSRDHNIWSSDEDVHHHHGHNDEHSHDHTHSTYDYHIWLNPDNAKQIANIVAAELSKIDLENANIYRNNAQAFIRQIDEIDQKIREDLADYRQVPYLVFHDAYQYYEKKYELHPIGALTLDPSKALSAKKLTEIEKIVVNSKVKCLFKEPQFSARAVDNIASFTHTSSGILDPEWGDGTLNSNSYLSLILELKDNLLKCFAN
jgi:zinc transport system substrate-binding protein